MSKLDEVARAIEAKSNYMISQHFAKALARAAIEAIRVPTDAMLAAAEPECDDEHRWIVMIDEVIK